MDYSADFRRAEALLPAFLLGASRASGEWRYAWVEAAFDPATGAYSAAAAPRLGSTSENYATELNGRGAQPGSLVWLRLKGSVAQRQAYEFDANLATLPGEQVALDGADVLLRGDTVVTQSPGTTLTIEGGDLVVRSDASYEGTAVRLRDSVLLLDDGSFIATPAQNLILTGGTLDLTAVTLITPAVTSIATSTAWTIASSQTWTINGPGTLAVSAPTQVGSWWAWLTDTLAAITADQAALVISSKPVVRVPVNGALTIHGITLPGSGGFAILVNVGSSTATVANDSSSASTTADRVLTPDGSSASWAAGKTLHVWADPTTGKNRVVGGTAVSGSGGGTIDGSGTASYLPWWSDPDTLGVSQAWVITGGSGGIGITGDLDFSSGPGSSTSGHVQWASNAGGDSWGVHLIRSGATVAELTLSYDTGTGVRQLNLRDPGAGTCRLAVNDVPGATGTLGPGAASTGGVITDAGSGSWAASSHSHAAADITSGTVATARLGSGTADATTFLRGDGTWAAPSGGTYHYVLLRDEKSAGTAGGTFSNGARRTRTLNTEASDTGGSCALSSSQFTLAAGTYRIRASAPAFYCGRHQAYLRNATAGSDVIVGTSEIAGTVPSYGVGTRSWVEGRFTANGTDAYEIQHECELTQAANGLGLEANFGDTEVYTTVELWKEP